MPSVESPAGAADLRVAPQVIEAEHPVAVVDENGRTVGVVDRYRLVHAMYSDRA